MNTHLAVAAIVISNCVIGCQEHSAEEQNEDSDTTLKAYIVIENVTAFDHPEEGVVLAISHRGESREGWVYYLGIDDREGSVLRIASSNEFGGGYVTLPLSGAQYWEGSFTLMKTGFGKQLPETASELRRGLYIKQGDNIELEAGQRREIYSDAKVLLFFQAWKE